MTVVASQAGFYPAGKRALISRSLVGLLQQTSRAFDGVSNVASDMEWLPIVFGRLLIDMTMCLQSAGLQGSDEGICRAQQGEICFYVLNMCGLLFFLLILRLMAHFLLTF